MLNTLSALENRLQPGEEIFFRWLSRVVAVAVLAGSAWLDDAPPLELAAYILTLYVVIRVAMQSATLYASAPFKSRYLNIFSVLIALVLLGLSYLTVAYFVYQLGAMTTN